MIVCIHNVWFKDFYLPWNLQSAEVILNRVYICFSSQSWCCMCKAWGPRSGERWVQCLQIWWKCSVFKCSIHGFSLSFLKGKLGWSESCCFAESLLTKCKTVLIVCHSWMWTVPDWPWGVHVRNFTGLSSDSCTVEAEAWIDFKDQCLFFLTAPARRGKQTVVPWRPNTSCRQKIFRPCCSNSGNSILASSFYHNRETRETREMLAENSSWSWAACHIFVLI